ncbi:MULTISPECIES: DUF6705 family protein [Bacteroidota]|uniref:DUF6705 family protein n=1 Tax=Bacteroidota TaxID=976 RepID=UPI0004F65395|nr:MULTISPECIES: DUF6705 family protein [Bacteroidota]AIM37882.1 hypothetical protein KO02_15195 [Sphingobacterium sp. ML3W]
MKKYISLVIVFLCSSILHGQEKVIILKKGEIPELKKGDYYRFSEQMEKEKPFEGVWEYKNGNENLIIKIEQKKTFTPKLEVFFDNPQLDYYYEKGNGEIISNSTLDGYRKSGRTIAQNIIKFSTSDVIKMKTIYIELELLGNNQARMTLNNIPGGITVVLPGESKPKKDRAFSIPTDIILTKK